MKPNKDVEIHYFSSAYEQDAMRVVRKKAPGSVAETALDIEQEGPYSYAIVQTESGTSGARIMTYDGDELDIVVPPQLGGHDVCELADRAFAKARAAKSIRLPQTVVSCGKNVFTGCAALERLEFSDAIEALDPSVLSACRALKTVKLPASLGVLPSRLLADCPVASLTIPRATAEVQERAFDAKQIVEFSVDPANEHYTTDGVCLYTKDGTVLERACRQVETYTVAPGCRLVSNGAFRGMASLSELWLGADVAEIGAFAFFGTSIETLKLPDSLRRVGEKAFCQCRGLVSVEFGSALQHIGEKAFAQTGLTAVMVPASVEELGIGPFDQSGVDYSDARAFAIDDQSAYLATDNCALYAKHKDGLALIRALRPLSDYRALDGTMTVDAYAFENNRTIESVELPEGVKCIGDKAFKGCAKLAKVVLPDTLVHLGEQAFWGTALHELHIGPAVTEIGECALSVAGDSRARDKAAIASIEVDAGNTRFEMVGPLLVEHADRGDVIRLYVGDEDECVTIPESVVEVSDLAFYHMRARELHVGPELKKIAPRAFLGLSGLQRVYVAYEKPVEGFTHVVIEYTPEPRDRVDMSRPLTFDKNDGLFFDYDAFDSMVVHEYEPGDVGRMALSRLAQPVKLKQAFKAGFDAALKGFLPQIVEAFEREGYEEGLERLERFGYR